ncbi:unnamed protein product, partial [Diabrotica balteata]
PPFALSPFLCIKIVTALFHVSGALLFFIFFSASRISLSVISGMSSEPWLIILRMQRLPSSFGLLFDLCIVLDRSLQLCVVILLYLIWGLLLCSLVCVFDIFHCLAVFSGLSDFYSLL